MELTTILAIIVAIAAFSFVGFVLWEDRTHELHKYNDIDDQLEKFFNSKNKKK